MSAMVRLVRILAEAAGPEPLTGDDGIPWEAWLSSGIRMSRRMKDDDGLIVRYFEVPDPGTEYCLTPMMRAIEAALLQYHREILKPVRSGKWASIRRDTARRIGLFRRA